MSSATVLRAVLLAACLLYAALGETVQLNESNVEGSIMPQELQSPPSAGTELCDYDQAASAQQQQEQQQLYVVALDGSPASSSTDTATSSNEASQPAEPSSSATDSLPSSSNTAAGAGPDPASWQLGSFPAPPPPPLQEPQAAAAFQGPSNTLAASATARQAAAANPAANAAAVSAVPNMGVAPAGSRVPGRYIVFFRSNVSSTQQGIDRCAVTAGGETASDCNQLAIMQ